MGLDRPLRLVACVLPSRQSSRLPSNQSLPNDSPDRPPTALPSRVRVPVTFTKKQNDTQKSVILSGGGHGTRTHGAVTPYLISNQAP